MSFKYKDKTIAGSGEFFEEVYSTKEVKIGTWMDGRPLYRVVISVIFNSASASFQTISKPIESAIMQKISAYIRFNSGVFEQIPITDSKGIVTRIYYNPNSGVQLQCAQSDWIGATIQIILEYTKTTDQVTIQIQELPQINSNESQERPNYQDFTAPVTAGM